MIMTCDMPISYIEENKRQRHVTLSFLKIDMRHGDPPSRGLGWETTDQLYFISEVTFSSCPLSKLFILFGGYERLSVIFHL